jgi:hypothetical protein
MATNRAKRRTGAGLIVRHAAAVALFAAGSALPYPVQNVALVRYPLGSIVARGWLDTQLTRLIAERGSRPADFEWGSAKSPLWDRTDDGRWDHGGRGAGWIGEMAAKYLYGQTLLAYTASDTSLRPTVSAWVNRIISDGFREPSGYIGNFLATDNRFEDYQGYPADYEIMALMHFFDANPGRTDVLAAARGYVGWFQTNWDGWNRGYVGQSVVEGALEVFKHYPAETGILAWCNRYSPRPDFLTAAYPDQHCVAYGLDVRIPALIACYDPAKTTYRGATVNGIDKVYAGEFLNHGGPATSCENTFSTPSADNEMEAGCNLLVWSENFAIMAAITGETRWADRLERIVFNATEGSRSKDEKSVPYCIRPNQYTTSSGNCYGSDLYHYGAYFRVPCCATASVGVLPDYVCSMYMHSPGGDLYVVAYGPSVLKAGGAELLTQTTEYPFGKRVSLAFRASLDHDLYIRNPGWSGDRTAVSVNGAPMAGAKAQGAYVRVPSPAGRAWTSGDVIDISFDAMDSVQVVRDTLSGGEYVSVERGPLLFACDVSATWTPRAMCSFAVPPADMPWYDVEPSGSVAQLQADSIKGSNAQIRQAARVSVSASSGYLWEHPPVSIQVPVNGGPRTVNLVPFGCTTLRKSYFEAGVLPAVGANVDASRSVAARHRLSVMNAAIDVVFLDTRPLRLDISDLQGRRLASFRCRDGAQARTAAATPPVASGSYVVHVVQDGKTVGSARIAYAR